MNTNKENARQSDLLLKNEVYPIVGAAMEAHSELGAGFLEAASQEAMGIEMAARAIPYKPQCDLCIHYNGKPLKKAYCADFICFDQIIVEIKAMKELATKEEVQLLNYLKTTGCRIGLLINFGDPSHLQ